MKGINKANRFNYMAYIKPLNKVYPVINLLDWGEMIEVIDENGDFVSEPDGVSEQFPARDFTLMQSTGLIDKNGEEIFEGYILKRNTKFYKVIFDEHCPSFCLVDRTNYISELDSDFAKKAEVAGNVFQNLELMK